jgi:hypothetical protein
MNICYLDSILSACFSLRKIKSLIIQEEKHDFSMRPQLHILIVSPFGTFKSSLTKRLRILHEKNIYCIDDFTKPGLEGSIGKDGDYVPPLLVRLGGKVLIIDEWNSIDYFGQGALLGLLENQKVARVLGFKVKTPYKYNTRYGKFSIEENRITGEVQFSCISYAMEYPITSQKDKALLSRFTPLFLQPTIEYLRENTRGNFEIIVEDWSCDVEDIIISNKAYCEFHDHYFNYIQENKLAPTETDDYGYIPRVMSDIIRLGVYNYLKQTKPIDKKIYIDDASFFIEMFDNILTMMQQYSNPKTKGKLEQYVDLLNKFPDRPKEFYYKTLGITRETLYQYDKKLKFKIDEVTL